MGGMLWRWSSLQVSPTGRLSPIRESPARVCKRGCGKGRLASRGLSHWPAHTRSRRHGPRQGPTADAPLGPTCARQRPMERQNGRPQHRPAGGFRLVSQRAVDSPPGWGRRLAQSFTCDRGSQSRTAAFTAMIKTRAVWPPPWEPSESAPTTQPRGSFFLPAPGNNRLNRYVWDTPNQLRFRSMDMGATHVARTQRSGLVPVLRRPGGFRLRVWRWSFSRCLFVF